MSKYIVKNCPCLSMAEYPSGKVEDNLCGLAITQYCKNYTDCLIKQVIEKMKEHPFCDCSCGNEILQLFEIEEVNNDN